MNSFLEDIEFAVKLNDEIKKAELRGIDNSVELTKEMIKQQYGDIEKLQQENQDLRKALKVYEEGKYQEHLKIQMAIEYIKNKPLYTETYDYNEEDNLELKYIDDEIAKNDLLEILGDKE